jgi:hypothetical protein
MGDMMKPAVRVKAVDNNSVHGDFSKVGNSSITAKAMIGVAKSQAKSVKNGKMK